MNEAFLQFLWRNKLLLIEKDHSTLEDKIKVLEQGELNLNSGPDFFNARVEIDGILWVGNIELHLISSDWYRHKHNTDPAYDNVILHVSLDHDKDVFTSNGRLVPNMVVKVNKNHLNKYSELMAKRKWVACEDDLFKVDPFQIKFWLGSIMVERLKDKSASFETLLKANKNDWEETFYQGLARSFGFKVNGNQFERLSRSLPIKYLYHYRDNLFQLEALLFGQSGLLSDSLFGDEYFKKLSEEYLFLKAKFQLKTLESHQWKFMRMRPLNFPTIRIAQFAALIFHSKGLFSKFMEATELDELLQLLKFNTSTYWDDHYRFNKISNPKKKFLGIDAQYSLLINTIIPFLYMYGMSLDKEELINRALNFLDKIPPERNAIIRRWEQVGVKAESAFYTQALLQLKNKYCKFKKCLDCEIGNRIIASKTR